jgi:ribose 5-phosphate isomerase B
MLYLATDHRGLKLKNQLKNWLIDKKIKFKDLGNYDYEPKDDYPDYAAKLTEKILESPDENKGVIFCGSGAGVSIACNKVKGIRAAIGINHRQVRSFVRHDHVQILAISADETTKFKWFQLVKTFLKTKWDNGERHLRRLGKIE